MGCRKGCLNRSPSVPSYLAFLGRISPEKRVDRAIHIAERCGLPLKIAAKVDPADHDYFEEMIRPLLAKPHVEFIGEISDAQKPDFLSGALALIVPIDWPEPFGLVMIEAMACGAPVVAFNRGVGLGGDRRWRDRIRRGGRNERRWRPPSSLAIVAACDQKAL